jgi:ATP-dependent DNA helicase RecQ
LSWTPVDIRYLDPKAIFGEVGSLDILIDVSVRTRPRDIRANDPLPVHHLHGMVPMYEIRTAYRRLPEAFIDWPAPRPVPDVDKIEAPLRYFLQTLFRRPDFLEKQLDVMKRAMLRKDVLGLLPTGGGKSLTFQLPTLLSPGVTLVIAPLKSLIDDQLDNLHRAGINRVAGIHSGYTKHRKEQAIREIVSGYPRFVYIAPERLHIKSFREDLRASPIARSLAFSVVDEAHCVSEWGHDFRPSYLSVAHQARALFVTDAGVPPIIALTATASNTVLTDIIRELQFVREDREAVVSVTTFDRSELQFVPITGRPDTKRKDLEQAIHHIAEVLGCDGPDLLEDHERAGIVFCRYVNGEFGVTGVSTHLQSLHEWGDGRVQIYSGSKPKKWHGTLPWEDHKRKVQRAFKDKEFPVLVATSSFGMGIDKENVRYTIHYGIPHSLEALAQEAGRAGRDRKPAACAVVYTDETLDDDANYLAPNLSTEEARERAKALSRREQGDASRVMFLLGTSYPGVDAETATLAETFGNIRDRWDQHGVGTGEAATLVLKRPYRDPASGQFDKALYRLTALGVVEDYTINYAARLVEVETRHITPDDMDRNLRAFVRRYGAEEAVADALATARQQEESPDPYAHLLRAICIHAYSVIEASRREALRNVVDALHSCNGDGKALAQRLNEFLSNNTFTARVAEITRDTERGPWFNLLEEAHNLDLAIQLVNAADRELESNPTHAGLHLLSGLGNVQRDSVAAQVIAERIMASLNYYETTFGKSAAERRQLVRDIMQHISERRRDRLDSLVATLLRLQDDDDIARAAFAHVTQPDLRRRCAVPWLREARDMARSLREELVEAAP